MKGIRGWYSRRLSEKMTDLQGKCDSYILFTKPMAAKMGIENKPYMVSEGFCDASIFDDIPDQEKYTRKTIVYGGNLSRLYGIPNCICTVQALTRLLSRNAPSRIPASNSSAEWIEKLCLPH